MKKIILLFSILSCCQVVKAQSGFPDPSFGNNGYIATYNSATGTFFTTIARECFVLPDGKFIMVLQAGSKTRLTRRLPDGSIDASYANNGYSVVASMIITAAAMQSDGKIIAAGNTDGTTDFMLARYNTDGTLDASFGNGGVVITDIGSQTDFLNAVIVTPGGKIIAGGSANINGHNHFALAQYTSSGAIDNLFGTNGILLTDFNGSSASLSSLTLQPNGRIIASGVCFASGNADIALSRFNADGSPDLTFNTTGKATSDFSIEDWGRSVALNNDGKIYVGGQSADASGYSRFTVSRYNADGSLDLSFNSGAGFVVVPFGPSYDYLVNIRIQDDGKVVAAGHSSSGATGFDIALTRINVNGTIDNGFGTNGNGRVMTDNNSGEDNSDFLVIQEDGKIVTGGVHTVMTDATAARFVSYRYNTDGTPDASFGVGGGVTDFISSPSFNYPALFQQTDGKLLAVREANTGIPMPKQFISRFNANGTPDNSYGTNGTYELNPVQGLSFFQPDGKLVRSGYSPANNGDIMLLRNNADGTPDPGFGNGGIVLTDFGASESTTSIAFQPDGKIIVGGIWRDANGSDFLVVRYNSNGSVDDSFGTGGYVRMNYKNEDNVQSIDIAPDGKIVFGGSSLTFPPHFDRLKFYAVVARLNPNGSFDMNFGDQGKTVIDKSDYDNLGKVLVQNDNKIVLSRYSNDGVIQHVFMERLNADGSPDNNFGQTGSVVCDGGFIIKQTDQKILVLGYKINNRNNTDFTLARFNADGISDMTFGANGKTTVSFTHLDNFLFNGYLGDNAVFASGSGVDVLGASPGLIAKFGLGPQLEQSITCPGDKVANTDIGLCSAKIYGIDPITTPGDLAVKYSLSGATTGSGNGSASGLPFNTGITIVTYTLADDPAKSCSFNITVSDNQVPAITGLEVSPSSLWPPNHQLKDVTVNYSVNDNCGIGNTTITVSSNEPVQGNEKHDESPDWQVIDNHHVRLRAERLGNGNGRIYTIKVTTTDINGNQQTATTTVSVPKSQGHSAQELVVTASPNPSQGYFVVTINSNSDDKIRVRLLDNKGTVLSTVTNISGHQTLEIGDGLKAGIYFLEVIQAGVKKTTRIIKQ